MERTCGCFFCFRRTANDAGTAGMSDEASHAGVHLSFSDLWLQEMFLVADLVAPACTMLPFGPQHGQEVSFSPIDDLI